MENTLLRLIDLKVCTLLGLIKDADFVRPLSGGNYRIKSLMGISILQSRCHIPLPFAPAVVTIKGEKAKEVSSDDFAGLLWPTDTGTHLHLGYCDQVKFCLCLFRLLAFSLRNVKFLDLALWKLHLLWMLLPHCLWKHTSQTCKCTKFYTPKAALRKYIPAASVWQLGMEYFPIRVTMISLEGGVGLQRASDSWFRASLQRKMLTMWSLFLSSPVWVVFLLCQMRWRPPRSLHSA